MPHDRAQKLLSYQADWRALFSWMLIIAAFSVISFAGVRLLP